MVTCESLTFGLESIADLLADSAVCKLLKAHHLEAGDVADPLQLDVPRYVALEEAGRLIAAGVRDGPALVGYVVYLVAESLHHAAKHAILEAIYLAPEYRQGHAGSCLIECADYLLKDFGVSRVYQHTTLRRDFGPVLRRLGYEHVENVWAKSL